MVDRSIGRYGFAFKAVSSNFDFELGFGIFFYHKFCIL